MNQHEYVTEYHPSQFPSHQMGNETEGRPANTGPIARREKPREKKS